MLSVLINTHMLMAASDARASSASSTRRPRASMPPTSRPRPDVTPLKEEDAYPAMPEDGYGWEKLFSERMCRHFREDFGLETRVARYHNVYGPHGTYEGGREKAPAAICRKVIAGEADRDSRQIEIWGDGEQTRSFMYIDDCLHGTQALMASDVRRADQPRQRRARHDQPARRHRRGHRRRQADAPLQSRRAEGRARPQQRQHAASSRSSAGRRRSGCATAWRAPIAGYTTS